MNYINHQRGLIHTAVEVVTELSLYIKGNKINKEGYLYTLYSIGDQKIRLGFYDLCSEPNIIDNESNWIMIGRRTGSKREEKLIKYSLIELGFSEKNSNYVYSKKLVRHLLTLGWPIGDLFRKRVYK